jgi:hypothetical protein
VNRVIQIVDSLHVIYIISRNIPGPAMKKTHGNLFKWFIGLMFDQTDGRVPLFGWKRMPFPLPENPAVLFSSPQKFLARSLMYSKHFKKI